MRRTMTSVLLLICLGCSSTVGIAGRGRGYAEVSPQVANEMLLDSRQIIVLDFRSEEDFAGPLGHIAGAVSTPLGSIELRLPELLPYQNSTVIAYGGTREESQKGASILVASGFRNVVVVRGGIREWIEKRYPTVSGS